MRVLVCGSRTWIDGAAVSAALFGWTALIGDDPEFVIIEGGARGADHHAAEWAKSFRPPEEHVQFSAEWDLHGKAAGPIRNQRMLDEGKPDMVLAFVNKPLNLSRGTADMVTRANRAGLPVYVTQSFREVGSEALAPRYFHSSERADQDRRLASVRAHPAGGTL